MQDADHLKEVALHTEQDDMAPHAGHAAAGKEVFAGTAG